jgi:hypothetical protein
VRSPIYPFVFDSVALALVTTMGVHWVLCAPRKAHGPRVITVADAKDYRMDDDYYYFGFDSEEARADANERVLVRIDEIRAEGRKKPHHLVVARLAGESIRWLILATGAFECINEGFGPVFAGDPERAHRSGVEFVSRVLLEVLDEPVDAAITTSSGYPLDLTYYQCIKGVTAASHIVKPGGSILLAAACTKGVGAPEFARMIQGGVSDAAFLEALQGAPVTVDQWQLEKLALVTTRQRLAWYVPGLPAEYHAGLVGPILRHAGGRRRRAAVHRATGRDRRGDSRRSVRSRQGAGWRTRSSLKCRPCAIRRPHTKKRGWRLAASPAIKR